MKHLKSVGLALVVGAGVVVLPMQAARAADPAEACGKALLNVLGAQYKGIGKALSEGCKGKSATDVDAKLVGKLNKAIQKLNKTNEKVDCATNQDPDNTTPYPIAEVAPPIFAGYVTAGNTLCNGIDDP